MRIATWNVNSLRVRLPQVLEWLASEKPDVVGLQETKVPDEDFPADELREAGFRSHFVGQRAYNGVALLLREDTQPEAADLHTAMPGLDDEQRRVIAATVGGWRIVNLYVPNGQSVGSDKYDYKLRWLDALAQWLASEVAAHRRLLVMGDFNIAPEDRDVHDPLEWQGRIMCSDTERDALGRLLDLGLADLFRRFEQPGQVFSWWDYRAGAFRRNRGLRIDLVLGSEAAASGCTGCHVDAVPRRWQRPSDHAPVVADFAGGA